eukprot:549582-Pelagomonas_calceolata.AAC.1
MAAARDDMQITTPSSSMERHGNLTALIAMMLLIAKHTSITSAGKLIISLVGYTMCTCSFLRFMGSTPV